MKKGMCHEIATLIANADNHVRKCTGTDGLEKNVIEVMMSHVDAHFAKRAVQKKLHRR